MFSTITLRSAFVLLGYELRIWTHRSSRRIKTGPLQFQRVQTQQRLVTATASLSPMLLLYSSTQDLDKRTLDKTISNLDTELASAKAAQESIRNGAPLSEDIKAT
ncbi:hypothetical protein HN51_004245 [Arachis hypogaea]